MNYHTKAYENHLMERVCMINCTNKVMKAANEGFLYEISHKSTQQNHPTGRFCMKYHINGIKKAPNDGVLYEISHKSASRAAQRADFV